MYVFVFKFELYMMVFQVKYSELKRLVFAVRVTIMSDFVCLTMNESVL